MNGIATVISTALDSLKRLNVKVLFQGKLKNGKGDLRTPVEASSFGVDSNPTEGKKALYMQTGVDGKYYVVGYLNTDRVAEVGETRLFSTDADGANKFNVWLKANSELLMGTSMTPAEFENFAMKFNEFKEIFNGFQDKFNSHIDDYNAHTHPDPASGSTGTTSAPSTKSNEDPDDCKHEKIKYND